jgi:hypothetical protein
VAGNLNQAPVQVTITTGSISNVLIVPVEALLAQPGGGYAVEVAGPGGHHLVAVTLGLFDDAAGTLDLPTAGTVWVTGRDVSTLGDRLLAGLRMQSAYATAFSAALLPPCDGELGTFADVRRDQGDSERPCDPALKINATPNRQGGCRSLAVLSIPRVRLSQPGGGGYRHRPRQQAVRRTACSAQILSARCP